MRKLLNSPWFVTALALAALVLLGRAFLLAPQAAGPVEAMANSAEETSPLAAGEGGGGPRLSAAAALKALAVPAAVRDPFALPAATVASDRDPGSVAAAEVVDKLRLSAIWVQGPAVLLLLNGRICQAGDAVERFTVEAADVDGAWVRHGGERLFLNVGQELAVRTTVPNSPTPLSP